MWHFSEIPCNSLSPIWWRSHACELELNINSNKYKSSASIPHIHAHVRKSSTQQLTLIFYFRRASRITVLASSSRCSKSSAPAFAACHMWGSARCALRGVGFHSFVSETFSLVIVASDVRHRRHIYFICWTTTTTTTTPIRITIEKEEGKYKQIANLDPWIRQNACIFIRWFTHYMKVDVLRSLFASWIQVLHRTICHLTFNITAF